MKEFAQAKRLNSELGLIELRAQATAVGLVQLCGELLKVGVLDDAAVDRIKSAISDQILVSYRPTHRRAEFAVSLRQRLNDIFPVSAPAVHTAAPVGTTEEIREALDTSDLPRAD